MSEIERNCNTCKYDAVGTFFMSEGQQYPRCEECHGAVETFTKWESKGAPSGKEFDPAKHVTITLPARLWQEMLPFLYYSADWNRAREYWWSHCCADGRVGAAKAKEFKQAADTAENLSKVIETAITD